MCYVTFVKVLKYAQYFIKHCKKNDLLVEFQQLQSSGGAHGIEPRVNELAP